MQFKEKLKANGMPSDAELSDFAEEVKTALDEGTTTIGTE